MKDKQRKKKFTVPESEKLVDRLMMAEVESSQNIVEETQQPHHRQSASVSADAPAFPACSAE